MKYRHYLPNFLDQSKNTAVELESQICINCITLEAIVILKFSSPGFFKYGNGYFLRDF